MDTNGQLRGATTRNVEQTMRHLAMVQENAPCFGYMRCTANEVQVLNVSISELNGQGPDENGRFTCHNGELIDVVLDTISLDVDPKSGRYNIGLLFSAIGGSPNDIGNTCNSLYFSAANGEGEDRDGDPCGDFEVGTHTVTLSDQPNEARARIKCEASTTNPTEVVIGNARVSVDVCATFDISMYGIDCDPSGSVHLESPAHCGCSTVEFDIDIN